MAADGTDAAHAVGSVHEQYSNADVDQADHTEQPQPDVMSIGYNNALFFLQDAPAMTRRLVIMVETWGCPYRTKNNGLMRIALA